MANNLPKYRRGSAFRDGRSVCALGSGRSASVADGATHTFTFTIKEACHLLRLIVSADSGSGAEDLAGITISEITHNNDSLLNGDAVTAQMFAANAIGSPTLGQYANVNDSLVVKIVNNSGAAAFFNATFTVI